MGEPVSYNISPGENDLSVYQLCDVASLGAEFNFRAAAFHKPGSSLALHLRGVGVESIHLF